MTDYRKEFAANAEEFDSIVVRMLAENAEIVKRCDELAAHVERLRDALKFIAEDHPVDHAEYLHPYYVADVALGETTAQSLTHIQAQVRGETIEWCIDFIKVNLGYFPVLDEMREYATRKYAKDGE